MLNKLIKKYFVLLTVIIFGSAFIIWGYNLIFHGRNLAKPPQFDLDIYSNVDMPHPEVVWQEMQDYFDQQKKQQAEQKIVEAVKEQLTEQQKTMTLELRPNTLYFTSYFQGDDYLTTKKMLENFMTDFPWLMDLKMVDLLAQACVLVKVPVEVRENILASMREEAEVLNLVAGDKGPPEYNLCFQEKKYHSAIVAWLEKYPQVELLSDTPAVGDYIAYIDFSEVADQYKEDIEYIKQNYSDVINITDSILPIVEEVE